MPLGLGLPELAIILVIVLLFVGPKKLPAFGKSLGSGMREFKDSIQGDKDKDESKHLEEHKPATAVHPPQPADAQIQTTPLPGPDPLRNPEAAAPSEHVDPPRPPHAD